MNNMKHTVRGFSLLELLLVVGVGAVLILAGLSAYRLVTEGNSATQGSRQLQTLKQQVQTAYQGESTYGSTAGADMVATMSNMKMLPADMPVQGTGIIRNAFNGDTNIVVGASPFSTFKITFKSVPTAACVKMGPQFSTDTASDFVGLTVNSAAVLTNNATVANLTATGRCSSTNANTMTWEFR